MPWISVTERLPDERKLVWIHVLYEPSPYDNVTERVSIGCRYGDDSWWDAFDFPCSDDFSVDFWMPLDVPEFNGVSS